MSWEATTWVVDHSKQKTSCYFVLLIIANHCHSDGTGAYPSIDRLARECRMSVRNVSRIIEKLEKSGELKIERNEGPKFTNLYSLPLIIRTPDRMSPLTSKAKPSPDPVPVESPDGILIKVSNESIKIHNTGYDTKTSIEQKTEPDLHLEQDTLRWMEDVWRYYCKRLGKFDQPKFEITKLEDRVGKETFRLRWLENCKTNEPDRTNLWLRRISQEFPASSYRAPKSAKQNPYDTWVPPEERNKNETSGVQPTRKAS